MHPATQTPLTESAAPDVTALRAAVERYAERHGTAAILEIYRRFGARHFGDIHRRHYTALAVALADQPPATPEPEHPSDCGPHNDGRSETARSSWRDGEGETPADEVGAAAAPGAPPHAETLHDDPRPSIIGLWERGYRQLVSIIPPGAPLAPGSRLPRSELGKIPGIRLPNGVWRGYPWLDHIATDRDIHQWAQDGASVGMLGAYYPGLDIDVLNEWLAQLVEQIAVEVLGPAPRRVGRAPKRLLMYRTGEPFPRIAAVLTYDGKRHLVEFLGQGKQYVIHGPHPAGGRYEWNEELTERDPDSLTRIDRAKVEHFFAVLKERLEVFDVTVELVGAASAKERANVAQADLLAPSIEALQECVALIPNTDELFPDRPAYVKMGEAIHAAAGPEHETEGFEVFADWAARHEKDERVAGNADTWRRDWAGIKGPHSVGWTWLCELAAPHGFNAGRHEFTADLPPKDEQPQESARPSLHKVLLALRERLATISDPLERDTERDHALAKLSSKLHVPFNRLVERLAAFDAPHRRTQVRIIRPGPQLRDAMSEAPPPALIPGYVFAESQHVLYGEPQAFKTFIALDMALHLASGRPWLDVFPVQQRGVVIFAGEAAGSLRLRIAAWCAAHGLSVEESEALPIVVIEQVPTLGRGDDGFQNAINQIREATKEFSAPLGLIVIDNMTRLAAVAGLSTTDTGEYGRLLADLDALGRVVGAATLTIYHSPVSDSKRPTGTYQTTANPDVIIKAEREEYALRTRLRVAPPHGKTRDTTPMPDLMLHLKVCDVRRWLTESYEKAGSAPPQTLANATSGADDFVSSAGEAPLAKLVRESRLQQFTSLVVEKGELADSANDPEGRLPIGYEVLQAVHEFPGLSQNKLRAAVRRKGSVVDEAVVALERRRLIEDRGTGGKHAYFLSADGESLLLNKLPGTEPGEKEAA